MILELGTIDAVVIKIRLGIPIPLTLITMMECIWTFSEKLQFLMIYSFEHF